MGSRVRTGGRTISFLVLVEMRALAGARAVALVVVAQVGSGKGDLCRHNRVYIKADSNREVARVVMTGVAVMVAEVVAADLSVVGDPDAGVGIRYNVSGTQSPDFSQLIMRSSMSTML